MDVILAPTPASLLEAVEQAFQQELEGRGEVLRWAITAVDTNQVQEKRTATVQAVVLNYSTPSLRDVT